MKFSPMSKTGAIAALLTLVLNVGGAWGGSCYEQLLNKNYLCAFKPENSSSISHGCAYFRENAIAPAKLIVLWSSYDYDCTCTSKGNFDKPKFNADKKILCIGVNHDDGFTAKVTGGGKKIKNGEYHDSLSNTSAVFECEEDPAC